MASDVDLISLSRNVLNLSCVAINRDLIRHSKQTIFELFFFVKKIPLSRHVEYVMDESMDE